MVERTAACAKTMFIYPKMYSPPASDWAERKRLAAGGWCCDACAFSPCCGGQAAGLSADVRPGGARGLWQHSLLGASNASDVVRIASGGVVLGMPAAVTLACRGRRPCTPSTRLPQLIHRGRRRCPNSRHGSRAPACSWAEGQTAAARVLATLGTGHPLGRRHGASPSPRCAAPGRTRVTSSARRRVMRRAPPPPAASSAPTTAPTPAPSSHRPPRRGTAWPPPDAWYPDPRAPDPLTPRRLTRDLPADRRATGPYILVCPTTAPGRVRTSLHAAGSPTCVPCPFRETQHVAAQPRRLGPQS